MIVRTYRETDEKEWLKCRLLSFYDSSYCEDIWIVNTKLDNFFKGVFLKLDRSQIS